MPYCGDGRAYKKEGLGWGDGCGLQREVVGVAYKGEMVGGLTKGRW